jgi:hypothetical protein
MELGMTSKVDISATMREVAYCKGERLALACNDVVMCLFPVDGKLYVGVVGSDYSDQAMVHAQGRNAQVEVTWAKPVVSYTTGMRFTTKYIPEGAEAYSGESSLVDREFVHVLGGARYDEESEIITLPSPLGSMVKQFLRVTKLRSKGYPDYNKWNDMWKWKVNILLAKNAEKARVECEKNNENTGALYLDGPAAITSMTMLTHTRYTRDALFSPNCGWDVCREITAQTGVYAPHTTIEKFLEYDNLPSFSYVWVDGMGAWTGNVAKGHCVRDTVRALFTGKHLAGHALVAYTVNIRGRKGSQEGRAKKDKRVQVNAISRWVNDNGYTMKFQPRLFQEGNMMTVVFYVVQKVNK